MGPSCWFAFAHRPDLRVFEMSCLLLVFSGRKTTTKRRGNGRTPRSPGMSPARAEPRTLPPGSSECAAPSSALIGPSLDKRCGGGTLRVARLSLLLATLRLLQRIRNHDANQIWSRVLTHSNFVRNQ